MALNGTKHLAVEHSGIVLGTHTFIPKDPFTLVKDAHEAAKKKNGILAGLFRTIKDLQNLEYAKRTKCLLAVDSTDLPKNKGFYFIDRNASRNRIFVSISPDLASSLIMEGKMYDVLQVGDDAIAAAEKRFPVALDVYQPSPYGGCLLVNDFPNHIATMVLLKPNKTTVRRTDPELITMVVSRLEAVETSGKPSNAMMESFMRATRH